MMMTIESYPSCFVLLRFFMASALKMAGNEPGALLNREKDNNNNNKEKN